MPNSKSSGTKWYFVHKFEPEKPITAVDVDDLAWAEKILSYQDYRRLSSRDAAEIEWKRILRLTIRILRLYPQSESDLERAYDLERISKIPYQEF